MMTIEIRRSVPSDRQAILALMDEARGDGLSATQRAERGFVQGTMDEAVLTKFEHGLGIAVAASDDGLAGFAMTSDGERLDDGPPKLTIEAAKDALGDRRMFVYGPAAVDSRFQGRGVLTMLLTSICSELRDRFELGVAFVEGANRKSLAIHRHYGMTEVPGFEYDERDYHVFAFASSMFVER